MTEFDGSRWLVYDLHRLRLLRELSHRGTLAAVAEALGYSPSSVSHQLARLEREVGVPLLEPAGRRVRLTAAADVLVRHTESILAELESAEAAIAASRTEVIGTVRLASFQTAAHGLVPDVVTVLSQRHPDLRVVVSQVDATAAISALVARDFDVVLSEHYPADAPVASPGVRTEAVLWDPLSLAIPAVWPQRRLAELAHAPWAMEPAGTNIRAWSTFVCRAAGFEPDVTFESDDVLLHARLVGRGLAAAFLPGLGVETGPEVRLVATGQARVIAASARTGGEANPAIAAVHAALREIVRGRVRRSAPGSRSRERTAAPGAGPRRGSA